MRININDAASGSEIIGFTLTVTYSEDRPLGQNLVPDAIEYCLADIPETTTTSTTSTTITTTLVLETTIQSEAKG